MNEEVITVTLLDSLNKIASGTMTLPTFVNKADTRM